MLTFVELPTFVRLRELYLDDDELTSLQAHLIKRPDAGDVIPVYFWRRADGQIVLITLYAKNVTDNIAPATLRALKEAFDDQT